MPASLHCRTSSAAVGRLIASERPAPAPSSIRNTDSMPATVPFIYILVSLWLSCYPADGMDGLFDPSDADSDDGMDAIDRLEHVANPAPADDPRLFNAHYARAVRKALKRRRDADDAEAPAPPPEPSAFHIYQGGDAVSSADACAEAFFGKTNKSVRQGKGLLGVNHQMYHRIRAQLSGVSSGLISSVRLTGAGAHLTVRLACCSHCLQGAFQRFL